MIEFHDPRAEIGFEPEPYTLGINLGNDGAATVAFLANGFPDSEAFLRLVAEAVTGLVDGVSAEHWNKGNASIPAPEEMLEEIRGRCHAAVAAYGH